MEFTEQEEKNIIATIMMFSRDTEDGQGREFLMPCLPDPKMGREFVDNIQAQFRRINEWMKQNPERREAAEHGHYILEDYLKAKAEHAERQARLKKRLENFDKRNKLE